MTKHTPRTRTFLWSLALVGWLAVSAASSLHAGTVSYSMMICENLDVLKNPENMTLAKNAAWKTQHTLMMERTMPYVEVRNTSEDAELMQFSMSIGDTTKNFDWAMLVEASPGVGFTLLSPDSVGGSIKSDDLVISFTGFMPGDFVRFRIGLAPDAPNASMVVDYRKTLFDMNGGDDISKNSVVTAAYFSTDGPFTLTNQLPNFPNNMPSATNLAFPHNYGMDNVMPFKFNDNGFQPPVPEPSTMALAGFGLLGLVGYAWRQRGRRKA